MNRYTWTDLKTNYGSINASAIGGTVEEAREAVILSWGEGCGDDEDEKRVLRDSMLAQSPLITEIAPVVVDWCWTERKYL